MALPTARFVPDGPVLTTGWARVPADLLVLALRVLCVMLAGLAFAGPFLQGSRRGAAKVLLADRSRAVADSGEVSDSVAAIRGPGDVVIRYGSIAFEETPTGARTEGERSEAPGRGSLSAALVAGTRAASRFRDRADSVELVIVSSFAAEEVDAATARVRREWPGRARLVVVGGRAAQDTSRSPILMSDAGDPFAVAFEIAKPAAYADVRIVRGALSESDSLWVAEKPARTLVHWPSTEIPAGFLGRAQIAPAGGLFVTAASTVIAPFQRRWQYLPALDRKPIAWWIDGDVAAAESELGRGCVRSVAVPVSERGDFVLRPQFHAALRDLVQPCGGAAAYERMPALSRAMLGGSGRVAPSDLFAQPRRGTMPATKWLLLASLACALLELLARRRRAREEVADARESKILKEKVA